MKKLLNPDFQWLLFQMRICFWQGNWRSHKRGALEYLLPSYKLSQLLKIVSKCSKTLHFHTNPNIFCGWGTTPSRDPFPGEKETPFPISHTHCPYYPNTPLSGEVLRNECTTLNYYISGLTVPRSVQIDFLKRFSNYPSWHRKIPPANFCHSNFLHYSFSWPPYVTPLG